MHLKQTALERQEDLFYSSSLNFQGDSASTALASELSQVGIALLPSQSSEPSGLETVAEKPWIWKGVILDMKARGATCTQRPGALRPELFVRRRAEVGGCAARPRSSLQSHGGARSWRLGSQVFEHKCVTGVHSSLSFPRWLKGRHSETSLSTAVCPWPLLCILELLFLGRLWLCSCPCC